MIITARVNNCGVVVYSGLPEGINAEQFADYGIKAIEREILRLQVENIYVQDVIMPAIQDLGRYLHDE